MMLVHAKIVGCFFYILIHIRYIRINYELQMRWVGVGLKMEKSLKESMKENFEKRAHPTNVKGSPAKHLFVDEP